MYCTFFQWVIQRSTEYTDLNFPSEGPVWTSGWYGQTNSFPNVAVTEGLLAARKMNCKSLPCLQIRLESLMSMHYNQYSRRGPTTAAIPLSTIYLRRHLGYLVVGNQLDFMAANPKESGFLLYTLYIASSSETHNTTLGDSLEKGPLTPGWRSRKSKRPTLFLREPYAMQEPTTMFIDDSDGNLASMTKSGC